MKTLQKIGTKIDEEGRVVGLDAHKFADFLMENISFRIFQGGKLYHFDGRAYSEIDDNNFSQLTIKTISQYIPGFWRSTKSAEWLRTLKALAQRVNKFSEDANLINFNNYLLNMEEGCLYYHTSDFFSLLKVDINYDAEADCPAFIEFLEDVFEGDQERIEVLQEFFGYCLTSSMAAQKALLLFGQGANGKSILLEIIRQIIGEKSVSALKISDLNNPFRRHELLGKAVNISAENEFSKKGFNTEFFKSIVAGDLINVDVKGCLGFSFKPTAKMVFALNTLPPVSDNSYGFIRRLLIIPFNMTYTPKTPGFKHTDELLNEILVEKSGIVNWALAGLDRLQKNQYVFSESKFADNILLEYRKKINAYDPFVEEAIEEASLNDRVSNADLVSHFQAWLMKNELPPMPYSNQKIVNRIRNELQAKNIFFEIEKSSERYTAGIRLK